LRSPAPHLGCGAIGNDGDLIPHALAGINVTQSDLPDPAQKQLATLIASNLRPHDAKSPPTFVLRVDTQDQGLHYTVQGDCAQ
jgi:hypothetical protein